MSFEDAFPASATSQGQSVASTILGGGAPLAGVFADGLITVLDAELSNSIAKAWAWALPGQIQPVAYTPFGDFLFQPLGGTSVYFFEVQRGKTEFVGPELVAVFNEFLPAAGVREHVLHEPLFKTLQARLGSLSYGSCFIPEPWPLLGGSGGEGSFGVGSAAVYISLVAQTLQQLRDKARRAQ